MSDPHPNATFQPPEPAELAPLFPGYDIECLIATGGMGAVYRAIQRSLDRSVAIKILPHEFSADTAFCAGFEAEAKAMARLNHPNLVGVYDFGEVNGMLYIIMEFVPGKSLFHSSYRLAIDPSEVIRLITGICHGLAHAHEHGIIHRDIKPSNILLDLNAQPKIGDFGLARPVEIKTQEGEEIFGTPHYTAPEVVNAPHTVDNRADVFSLGVMLHELLTGCLPADDPRSASTISHCDPRFDAIIRKATHPRPEERYSSVTEIAADLHHISTTAGPKVLQTARPGHSQPLRGGRTKSLSSNQSSPMPVILILLIITAGAAYFFFQPSQQQEPPTITSPEETIAPSPDTDAPPAPVTPQPTPEPTTEPEIVVAPEPEPEPEPVAPAVPIFNVEEFFGRARKIMAEKSAPATTKYTQAISENFEDFCSALKRQIRKMDRDTFRDRAEEQLEERIPDWKENDYHIPEDIFRKPLSTVAEKSGAIEEFGDKRAKLDQELAQKLAELAKTYILGLELQIKRLNAAEDPVAVSLIQEEITRTKEDPGHFHLLMMGKEISIRESDDEE